MPDLREVAAGYADHARQRFLNTFSHVPDDKLDWSPVPGANSPLTIAFHLAGSAEWFVPVLAGAKPDFSGEEKKPDTFTRDCAVKSINASTDAVIEAIRGIPEEKLETIVDLGKMQMPLGAFIMLPGRHVDGHACQVDYIQTCWGDQEFYF